MEMIRKEWASIRKNKILLLSFVVICFIPILYASFFLKSIWDPYGKTGNLPVAVVNNDKQVEYEGETLNVGQQVVDELKKDDNLDWNFVTAEEAKEGLKNQDYYMIVTFPEDFSANAATVMDENPQKMNIQYETNGAVNYLGEVIGETAIKQLKSSVSEKVTETYAKAIFDQLSEVGDGFADASDGANQLDDGTAKIEDGGQELADNLQTLASSTVTFSDGEETFSVGLNKYLEGVSTLDGGLTQLRDGVSTLGSKVPELADGVTQLSDGSETLASGINDYTAGVSQVADGTSTLASKGTDLKSGVLAYSTALSDGTTKLQGGASQINGGLNQMSSTLGTQINGSAAKLAELQTGLSDFNTKLKGLRAMVDANAVATATAQASTDLQTIGTSTDQITATVDAIKADTTNMQTTLSDNSSSVVDAVLATNAYASLTDEQKEELKSTLETALANETTANQEAITNISNSITANADAIATNAQAVNDSTSSVSSSITEVSNQTLAVSDLQPSIDALSIGFEQKLLPGTNSAITTLSTGLVTVKTTLDKQLIPGMTSLETGLSTLQTGISTGSTQLGTGVDTYLAGVNQVNAGVQKLNSNSAALNKGASKISKGLGTLNSSVPTLQEGVNKLVDGTQQAKDGSAQLVANNGALLEGQAKLQDGATKIADGSAKLSDGSLTLVDALHTLKDGTSELSSGLQEGSDKVNSVHTSDKTAEMMAAPDTTTQQKYSEVPNYGHALAPYVLSLALYVGCLVFNFIFPIRKIAIKEKSAFQWWLSKVSVGVVAATAMAFIEGFVMVLLGLDPGNIREYYVVAWVTAMAYMFMIMFLAMAFDNPGRFVAMVLLILQLAGSGGTFPMPLTSHFFKSIHPYLPMTHSIYGFRQAISSGLGRNIFIDNTFIMLGIAIGSMLLLLGSMILLKKLKKDGISQLDDNQKLLDDNYDYSYEH
jgi:putative membrane protein